MNQEEIDAVRADNPLYNAPPRVSDLQGEARQAVLAARDQAARKAFMAKYTTPPRPSAFKRVLQIVRRSVERAA